jgi:hypothetical protein
VTRMPKRSRARPILGSKAARGDQVLTETSRIGLLRDAGRLPDEGFDNCEPPVLGDDALELRVFVVERDQKAPRVSTDGFVLGKRRPEPSG